MTKILLLQLSDMSIHRGINFYAWTGEQYNVVFFVISLYTGNHGVNLGGKSPMVQCMSSSSLQSWHLNLTSQPWIHEWLNTMFNCSTQIISSKVASDTMYLCLGNGGDVLNSSTTDTSPEAGVIIFGRYVEHSNQCKKAAVFAADVSWKTWPSSVTLCTCSSSAVTVGGSSAGGDVVTMTMVDPNDASLSDTLRWFEYILLQALAGLDWFILTKQLKCNQQPIFIIDALSFHLITHSSLPRTSLTPTPAVI